MENLVLNVVAAAATKTINLQSINNQPLYLLKRVSMVTPNFGMLQLVLNPLLPIPTTDKMEERSEAQDKFFTELSKDVKWELEQRDELSALNPANHWVSDDMVSLATLYDANETAYKVTLGLSLDEIYITVTIG